MWLLDLFKEKEPCKHNKNNRENKFRLPDGTPMVDFVCFDCGYEDRGHVYAGEDWPVKKITLTHDGQKLTI